MPAENISSPRCCCSFERKVPDLLDTNGEVGAGVSLSAEQAFP
jgi:hypothetical protein